MIIKNILQNFLLLGLGSLYSYSMGLNATDEVNTSSVSIVSPAKVTSPELTGEQSSFVFPNATQLTERLQNAKNASKVLFLGAILSEAKHFNMTQKKPIRGSGGSDMMYRSDQLKEIYKTGRALKPTRARGDKSEDQLSVACEFYTNITHERADNTLVYVKKSPEREKNIKHFQDLGLLKDGHLRIILAKEKVENTNYFQDLGFLKDGHDKFILADFKYRPHRKGMLNVFADSLDFIIPDVRVSHYMESSADFLKDFVAMLKIGGKIFLDDSYGIPYDPDGGEFLPENRKPIGVKINESEEYCLHDPVYVQSVYDPTDSKLVMKVYRDAVYDEQKINVLLDMTYQDYLNKWAAQHLSNCRIDYIYDIFPYRVSDKYGYIPGAARNFLQITRLV